MAFTAFAAPSALAVCAAALLAALVVAVAARAAPARRARRGTDDPAAPARRARRGTDDPAGSADGSSGAFAPGEWLYANYAYAGGTSYPSLAAAQAACAADALCVGVGAPLTSDYLAGVAPAGASGAVALSGPPVAGYAPTPIVYFAKLAELAPGASAPFAPAAKGWAAADDAYACVGSTSVEGACVMPSRALGERACAADPGCLGYARPPPYADMEIYFGGMNTPTSAIGAVRLLGAPPVANPLAAAYAKLAA